MKKRVAQILITVLILWTPMPARADLFGGDVAVLTQILATAFQQLSQLQSILSTGQSNLDLIRQINQGINDSLSNLQALYPNLDPGLYRDWTTVQGALGKLQTIYGTVPVSRDSQIQNDTDQSVAEAITFNNSYYEYSKQLDQMGEQIKQQSHAVSPGGAEKLSAQALGLMIQVLNQMLRAQATSMKLQAQNLALENRRDKEGTRHYLDATSQLTNAMKTQLISFQPPRF